MVLLVLTCRGQSNKNEGDPNERVTTRSKFKDKQIHVNKAFGRRNFSESHSWKVILV